MEDGYHHKGLRQKLAKELESKGIANQLVLNAIASVPRHLFIPMGLSNLAYKDQALPIGNDQTISQPYTVAFQTQLLDIQKGCKVLEIGTGSGYQAAVLLETGARVFTIERIKDLYNQTRTLLNSLNYFPTMFYGDGYEGKPTYGPYDRILITAAAPEIPEKLIQQLKPGGKMVIPLGKQDSQTMTLIEKNMEGQLKSSTHGLFAFVPMIKGNI
ncbi:MAG: protein-L-isoaspartate O-methyltransferase [Bacteroidetes bacterium HGW-Bacteroidetes-21]|jgi:protein-L-isoaspartate(D-aspartate) O-methyltransferase|nr:MAG: protein-L-isoaspartate O-methyltransferase [Bacteroidetes bacterium HGW-Bacteroidetes-21]